MSSVIEKLEREQLRRLPDFRAGDRVRVHLQVVEGSRRRTQVFEGVVIARSGHGVRETVTVRKQSFGVGVERVFPLHSPKIEKIEVAGRGDVRRAKLYYLRERVGRRARVRERTDLGPEQEIQRELLEGPPPVEEPELEGVESPDGEAPADAPEAASEADAPTEVEAAADGDAADAGDSAEQAGSDADSSGDEAEAASEPVSEVEAEASEEPAVGEADGAEEPAEGETAEEGA